MDFEYDSGQTARQKIRTRCNGEYSKCKHYKLHKARNNDIACHEFLHKSKNTIYCKSGNIVHDKESQTLTYYMNKCCSMTGHKTCCNYPQQVIKKQDKPDAEKIISWIDSIYKIWEEDRKRKLIRMYKKGGV
jgi:uncharacterized Fe-S cluster-containing MiaB family protein